jgi:type IV secretory pathway VirB10-like protein
MFDAQRERSVTTDSHRIVGSSKKPILVIGGAVGAIALVVIIVLAMRSKDGPRTADKPKATPDRVEPVVKPPPDDVVAVVTPDAAETPPPDDTTPPPDDPPPDPNPNTGNPKNPRTPKNPRIRGTKTTPIETGKGTPDPVRPGGDRAERSEKARAAYSAGNQKLFAGDADGAIVAYRQVIAMGAAAGYRGLGLAYAQQGDNANAIAAFKKYVQLSPNAKDVALIKKRIAALQSK